MHRKPVSDTRSRLSFQSDALPAPKRNPLSSTISELLRPRLSASLFATTLAMGGVASAQQAESGETPEREETALEEIIVRGVSFRHEGTVLSANKMPLPLKNTPQSVKVITQDLIDFAGLTKFEDLYKVDASSGTSHAGDAIPRNYFRGFHVQGVNTIKVNGFRVPGFVQLDLAPFARFEIVKGATSTLYGQNPVAGTLNAVSKAPLDTFGGEISVEAGSYHHYRADVDLYGPLTDDGALTYRMVGAYLNEESYVDFAYNKRIVFAPTLQYEFSENTSLIARLNYQDYDFTPYYGFGAQFLGDNIGDPAQLTADNFRIPPVPRSRTGNNPNNWADKEARFVQSVFEHRFDDGNWVVRANAQYSETPGALAGHLDIGTDQNGFTDVELYGSEEDNEVYSGEVNIYGDVEFFGGSHTLFLGADYADLENSFSYAFTDIFGVDSGFSIFNPDYSLVPFPATPAGYDFLFLFGEKRKISGVTAQALLRPLDGLIVSLGTRYSHDVADTKVGCCDQGVTLESLPAERLEEDEVTFQAGVTYALTDNLNAYASYGETFEPQGGFVAEGVPIDPEEGRAYEVGLKGELSDQRLSYSVAAFHMERNNIAQGIPGTPFLVPVGTQRSRGVEIDFQGELLEGWDVYGSFAFMDAEFTEGGFAGATPANAPEFGASLFTSYEIQEGSLQGLGVGLGLVHKSGRDMTDLFSYGALTPVLLDDFTELDLRVFYTQENWLYELQLSNVLDTEYYSNAFAQLITGFQVNPPRQVLGTVRYRF